MIQPPSSPPPPPLPSLDGQSCYLSADFQLTEWFLNLDGPGFWANKCFKVFFTALFLGKDVALGKSESFDRRLQELQDNKLSEIPMTWVDCFGHPRQGRLGNSSL